MQARELRQRYLEFFENKGALRLPSESLVADDPALMFIVAGMVPMKPFYENRAVPPSKSVTTAQKCLRTVDIDDIGDTSHCTFFEMLGNFSFGDYFKREAIHWAWEFLTQDLRIPGERLAATPHESPVMRDALASLRRRAKRHDLRPFDVDQVLIAFLSLCFFPLSARGTLLRTLGRDAGDPAFDRAHREHVLAALSRLVMQ